MNAKSRILYFAAAVLYGHSVAVLAGLIAHYGVDTIPSSLAFTFTMMGMLGSGFASFAYLSE